MLWLRLLPLLLAWDHLLLVLPILLLLLLTWWLPLLHCRLLLLLRLLPLLHHSLLLLLLPPLWWRWLLLLPRSLPMPVLRRRPRSRQSAGRRHLGSIDLAAATTTKPFRSGLTFQRILAALKGRL